MSFDQVPFRELILETKDGDWGKDEAQAGFIAYHVIRGGDFPTVELGDITTVPKCYLKESTVSRRTLKAGDLLIETAGGTPNRPTGRVLFISQELLDKFNGPVTCASFARFIRLDSTKVNPKFIFWYLRNMHNQGQMWQYQVQHTGISRFQWTKFADGFSFDLPSRDVQDQITNCLDALSNKIIKNKEMNQTLEAMAQSIFKSWFVDFDPVKAKIAAIEAGEDAEGVTCAAMRAISGKTDDELDNMQAGQPENYARLKTTAELFPVAMQDSELGKVPGGWEVSTIGDEVEVVGGGTPSTKNPEFWDGGEIHWTTPKDLSNLSDKVLLTTDRKITDAGLKEISSRLLPINTVLMSSRAPVGYLALAKVPVAVNQGYIAMLCDKRLSPEFVIQWCNSVMDEIKQRSSGTTFAEISKKNFKVIPLVVPSEGIQQTYSKLVSDLYNKIAETAMECKTLSDIRDSLLPKLLSGEITP